MSILMVVCVGVVDFTTTEVFNFKVDCYSIVLLTFVVNGVDLPVIQNSNNITYNFFYVIILK